VKRIAVLAAVLLTVGLGFAGCTSGSTPRGDGLPHTTAELIAFLRATASSDYEPFRSPAAMLAAVDVDGYGDVAAVTSGNVRDGDEDTGIVIVRLRLSELWKGPAMQRDLFFSFHRPTNVNVSVYRQSLPLGTGVAVFGFRTLERIVVGAPSGQVYSPTPMGLLFEVDPGSLRSVEPVDGYPGWHTNTSLADLRRVIGR
jgi:hypothetical protein